jgi:hypothetical protein
MRDGLGAFGHFHPRSSPTAPTMDAITPPSNIHIALSVGEPVKKREMSEEPTCILRTGIVRAISATPQGGRGIYPSGAPCLCSAPQIGDLPGLGLADRGWCQRISEPLRSVQRTDPTETAAICRGAGHGFTIPQDVSDCEEGIPSTAERKKGIHFTAATNSRHPSKGAQG